MNNKIIVGLKTTYVAEDGSVKQEKIWADSVERIGDGMIRIKHTNRDGNSRVREQNLSGVDSIEYPSGYEEDHTDKA